MAVEEYLVYIVAGIASVLIYMFSNILLFKNLIRVLGKEFLVILRISIALLSISLFLAVTAYIHGVHEIFVLIFTLFIITFLVVVIGARHLLEEYMTGIFASKAFDLKVGDYIEIGDIRGYITALDDTNVIIRDTRRGIVYVPYTMFAHTPFKRAKIDEEYEVRVAASIDHFIDLEEVRRKLNEVAKEIGLVGVRLDVEAIGPSGVTLSIKGIIRDPRREDEVRHAVLNKLYSMLSPTREKIHGKAGENPQT